LGKNGVVPKISKKVPTADAIAELASRGEDVSVYFTNKFTVVRSRQTAVKTSSRRALKEKPTSRPNSRKKAF
jgi:hypothetical protein